MGRRRSSRTKSLPPNLYERDGYFAWRDPRDGKEYGLGRDRRAAITQTIEANHEVAGTRGTRSLVDRIVTGPDNSVAAWCDRCEEGIDARLDGGKLARTTHAEFRRRLRLIRKAFGDRRIDSITTRDISDFLEPWEREGKARMAQALRSFLLDFFRSAQAKGWIAANPVDPTKAPEVEVQRARLTLDDFLAIHAVAVKEYAPWLARAMELALVTGQRREDVASLGPRDVRDEKLWVIPGKTSKHGTRIAIPLALRLQAVNWSVGEVIARCRDNVLARTFIHHSAFAGRAKPGDKLRAQTISEWFSEARDKSGRTWPEGSTPPSFHEIRSLASRLYAKEGVNVQALLGHKTTRMSDLYRDSRGAEWVEVRIPG